MCANPLIGFVWVGFALLDGGLAAVAVRRSRSGRCGMLRRRVRRRARETSASALWPTGKRRRAPSARGEDERTCRQGGEPDQAVRLPQGGRWGVVYAPAGAFLTVFGPNGAGKTTLLRMLATLARPSAGAVEAAGFDAREDPDAARFVDRSHLARPHALPGSHGGGEPRALRAALRDG